MSYFAGLISRFKLKLADANRIVREHGVLAGAAFVLRLLARWQRTIIFEKPIATPTPESRTPSVLRITQFDRDNYHEYRDLLSECGLNRDPGFLAEGAEGFVAWAGDEPLGVGWRFHHSIFLERGKYPRGSVYLGGYFVVPAARGRGVYPILLRAMSEFEAPAGAVAIAETATNNHASQSGLIKAGFVRRGILTTISIFGFSVVHLLRGDDPR